MRSELDLSALAALLLAPSPRAALAEEEREGLKFEPRLGEESPRVRVELSDALAVSDELPAARQSLSAPPPQGGRGPSPEAGEGAPLAEPSAGPGEGSALDDEEAPSYLAFMDQARAAPSRAEAAQRREGRRERKRSQGEAPQGAQRDQRQGGQAQQRSPRAPKPPKSVPLPQQRAGGEQERRGAGAQPQDQRGSGGQRRRREGRGGEREGGGERGG